MDKHEPHIFNGRCAEVMKNISNFFAAVHANPSKNDFTKRYHFKNSHETTYHFDITKCETYNSISLNTMIDTFYVDNKYNNPTDGTSTMPYEPDYVLSYNRLTKEFYFKVDD